MKRSTGLAVVLAVILLTSVFLLIIGIQEQRLQSLDRSTFLAEVQSWLPAMPEIVSADNLASIKALKILESRGRIDSSSVQVLAAEIKEEFGGRARFVVADPQLQAVESSGFTASDHDAWLEFFGLYRQLNLQGRIPLSDNVNGLLKRFLGESFNHIFIENYLTTYAGIFAGQEGVILVGCRMDEKMPKQVFNRLTMVRYGDKFDEHLCGYYVIFLPRSVYGEMSWYRKNQGLLRLNDDSEIFTGRAAELTDLLKKRGYAAAAGSFAAESAAKPNGVFVIANRAFSFCTVQLSGNAYNERVFSMIVSRMPEVAIGLGNNLFKAIVIVSLLLIVILCVNNLENQRHFSLSIGRHFSLLAACACLLPVLALLFQALSQMHVQAIQARSEEFSKLENKIVKLENNYQNRLSEMLLTIQLFHERCVAGEKTIAELRDEYSAELRTHSIREVYVCDRSGHIEPFRVNDPRPENVEGAKEGQRLMRLLVQFIQHNVKFVAQNARMSVGDGLIIESVAEVIGRESLYKFALQQNQLQTFKVLHGAIWVINYFQYDENNLPVKFFIYVISRAPFQERMIDEWQAASTRNYPDFLLANQSTSFREKLTPTWLESKPGFVRLLRHLNSAGGSFRTDMSDNGQRFLTVGRSLDDIDWSIVALEGLNGSLATIPKTSFLLFSAIVFLMLVIVVISRYFARIFLVPVKQLSSSVAAMAEGNYDMRLPVDSHDEIGQLCENFNSMAASLKEKEYLNRFLSDIAREAISGKVAQRATRVEGTILFSDIRNFTSMTEQKNPEEIVQMLNEFMTEAEAVVVRHSGTIEKFIGDAIMVVFLPALGTAAPAVRATRAAEELLEAIAQMNARRKNLGLFTISIGAGVATGSLLMGTIGNQQGRRDYSVTGKTVLLAAAMEKLTRQVSGKKIVLCPVSAELVIPAEFKTKQLKTADKETGYELL